MQIRLLCWCILYVSAAISASILKQYLDIAGISDNSTLAISQVTFLGYAFSGTNVITSDETEYRGSKKAKSSFVFIMAYVLILILGTYLCNLGVSLCGSGIFQVLYSSVIIFTTIISYFTTGKKKNLVQMVGIFVIFGGLSASALPHMSGGGGNSNVIYGALLSLLGTFVISLSYIIDEYLMDNFEEYQISAKEFSLKAGLLAFNIVLVYQGIAILPRWRELTVGVKDWNAVGIFFALQFLADAFNNITYYVVIAEVGATTCGVMQGLVSCGVFILSALLFCSTQSHQCFTYIKGVSTLLVVSGICIYSFGSSETPKEKTE